MINVFLYYSVLRATTGSFLAADDAGKTPEIKVKTIDTIIIRRACDIGNAAILNPTFGFNIRLIINDAK